MAPAPGRNIDRIVFHGKRASPFAEGFAALLGGPAEIVVVPDLVESAADRQAYAGADAIVSFQFDSTLPFPERLALLHVPGAGYDGIDLALVPPAAVVCNCFGHEQAMAEYVFAALLQRAIPLAEADRLLRTGDWRHGGGSIASTHAELAGQTLGILGYGHIGQAIATRAKAFEMTVHVANRTPVAPGATVDRWFALDGLTDFWPSADAVVVALPLVAETLGIVGAAALAAMRRTAVLINVGRGPLVDEQALYRALHDGQIAGAAIDTWYVYPRPGEALALPANLPFHELPNVLLTPHMSAWTMGTIRRRQRVIADNIERRRRGEPCRNVVSGS